jgi:hypothetical protein
MRNSRRFSTAHGYLLHDGAHVQRTNPPHLDPQFVRLNNQRCLLIDKRSVPALHALPRATPAPSCDARAGVTAPTNAPPTAQTRSNAIILTSSGGLCANTSQLTGPAAPGVDLLLTPLRMTAVEVESGRSAVADQ